MKIVVLDGYTLNPGDLSWDELEGLGECTVYDRTAPDKLLERAKGARVLLTNKVILDREAMEQLPDLSYVGVLATGYNVVDAEAAVDRGVVVTNVPAYSTDSVAQLVFALLLEQSRFQFQCDSYDGTGRSDHGHRRIRCHRKGSGQDSRSLRDESDRPHPLRTPKRWN